MTWSIWHVRHDGTDAWQICVARSISSTDQLFSDPKNGYNLDLDEDRALFRDEMSLLVDYNYTEQLRFDHVTKICLRFLWYAIFLGYLHLQI